MEILKIAIVDDEVIQRQLMVQLIQEACQDLTMKPTIYNYPSGEAFLFDLEDHGDFDLVFLDIQMGQLTGMEVAYKIRQHSQAIHIVFATAYPEYAIEGYQVSALDYLLKPISKDNIIKVLSKHRNIQPYQAKYIFIEDLEGNQHSIDLNDLISVEVQGRDLILETHQGNHYSRGGLKAIREDLDDRFASPHRSYLVNLRHVDTISKDQVLLSNKTAVPLSRRKAKDFQAQFVNYYKQEVYYE